MSPQVIGVYGNGIGAGKSTVAALLVDRGFKLVSFAAPMKDMVVVLLQALGYDETTARMMVTDQHRKKKELPGIDVSPRHLLRTLGTEWGREQVCSDLWLKCWHSQARHYLRAGFSVVCDDLRFENELELVQSLPNSKIWCVEWEGAEISAHASDNSIPDDYEPDRRIVNNEGLEELQVQVLRALRD
jgi:hypothetical protein